MRALVFCLIGTGFLFLIAFSWHAGESGAPVSGVASVPTDFTREPASNANASRTKIQQLSRCLESDSCVGARATAGDALAVALAEHFSNYGADADLARSALQSPAPLAQAVGLRMLASLPPSGESLSALGNGLRHSTDPALAEGAVKELERYLGTTYEADAQRIVEHLVGYGERSPAQRAAALARPFINEHSYEEFRELLGHLDAGAEAARFLKAALNEYERRK